MQIILKKCVQIHLHRTDPLTIDVLPSVSKIEWLGVAEGFQQKMVRHFGKHLVRLHPLQNRVLVALELEHAQDAMGLLKPVLARRRAKPNSLGVLPDLLHDPFGVFPVVHFE